MGFTVFHQVERYHVASQGVGILRRGQACCRILEVGAGRHSNLLQYLPQDDILFTDIIYTEEDLLNSRFRKVDATQLPFEDHSFDFVIGLDVLEHIPAEKRACIIKEAFRVARLGVFLSFPHASVHSSIGDELASIYRQFQKEPPIWLHEHDEMGLPVFDDIREIALDTASPERVYTAHAIDHELNRILLRLEAYTSCNPDLTEFFVQINDRYVESILRNDLGTPYEDAVKSYIVLNTGQIAPEICGALDLFFSQHNRQVIHSFGIEVSQSLKHWLAEQSVQKKGSCNTMEDQNVITAMLEVADRLDQMIKRYDHQADSLEQEEQRLLLQLQSSNVTAQVNNLVESAARQESLEAQVVQQLQSGDLTDQMNHLVDSAAQQTNTQNEIIQELRQANVVKQINRLVRNTDQQTVTQLRMLEELKLVSLTEHVNQVLDQISQHSAAQMKMMKEIKEELSLQRAAQEKIILNIILITYNQEKYIRQTLQSILDQKTDFRFNILVADDCSKDKTVSIIQEMEKTTDIPFVYLSNDHNLGIMQNYKRAFAACDAEYVAIMEGDDIWVDPYRLQKHKDFLASHPECAMSFNQFIVKDFKKGIEQIQPAINHENQETYRLFTGHDLAYDNLIGNFSTCVYKNAYLQKLPQQLYDVHAYDWLTNIFISQMGCIGCLLQPMSIYRIHAGGTWSQKKQHEKLQEIIDAIIVYDKLTNEQFTLGFTAHRQRLEEQLRWIEYQMNPPQPVEPAPAPVPEVIPEAAPPAPVKKRPFKRAVKRAIVLLRTLAMKTLDCLPPIFTTILKFLVPAGLVRRIKNMRAE